jgi:WD40 repeat protein
MLSWDISPSRQVPVQWLLVSKLAACRQWLAWCSSCFRHSSFGRIRIQRMIPVPGTALFGILSIKSYPQISTTDDVKLTFIVNFCKIKIYRKNIICRSISMHLECRVIETSTTCNYWCPCYCTYSLNSCCVGMELKDNILVSGNADSTVKIWDILSGQCLQTLSG